MDLVERDVALMSLTEWAADAIRGDSRLVLVAGEAGAGKTALLETLRDEHLTDARWLWGMCDSGFTPLPLGPVFDVARQTGGRLAAACDSGERDRMFRALLDELDVATGLTVLVFEDVHWADEATLDLLRYLGPRLRGARALVLVSYRDDALPTEHRLRQVIGELATHRAIRRIGTPPLSRQAVDGLAAGAGLDGPELFTLTAGNAFLVTEVIAAGRADVPQSARDAVLARVASLTTAARGVLETAAIIGPRVEVDLLEAVAGSVAGPVDDCLAAGALLPAGNAFRFRHEIARRAVAESIPPHRRTDLHRRILGALRARGGDDARLAHHAEGAGDAVAVLTYARRAGMTAVSMSSHREAATQFGRALRFAQEADLCMQADLHDALADAESMLDHWELVEQHRREAIALWRQAGDVRRLATSLRKLSIALWRLCRSDEQTEAATEALELLLPLPVTVELAWAHHTYSSCLWGYGRLSEALEHVDRAAALADQFGDKALLSECINSRGAIKDNLGRDGLPDLHESLDIAVAANADEQAGRAYANLAVVYAAAHRFAEAEVICAQGVAYSQERDMGVYLWCIHGASAGVLEKVGRWDQAVELNAKIVKRPASSPVNLLGPWGILARIHVRRGEVATGLAYADDVVQIVASDETLFQYGANAYASRAEAAWIGGRLDEAAEHARMVVRCAAGTDPWQRGMAATLARRVCAGDIAVGDVAPPYQLMLEGDFRAAARMWASLGCPYDEALALIDAGEEDTLRDALALLDKLGARAVIPVVQERLRQIGVRSVPRGARATTRADRWGLTAREREVLAEMRSGRTNAEIGTALFIAEKTVDNHVSNILAKMGVGSRREAARLADEMEPAPAI
ncbi:MAG: hypothetical protein QOE84_3422 [Actinomycetota bacterium]|nr:hypothetical protein [Actinomycetota bacterium]